MIVHADDFGITLDQSKRILSCSTACNGNGALNSTSALVTSPAFAESAAYALPYVSDGRMRMGLHFNIVEGNALSDPVRIPLLASQDGSFNRSFLSLLCLSLVHHKELEEQVCIEAEAQITQLLEVFPFLRNSFRLDSHQHTHMIPAVFHGLLAATAKCGVSLEYVRVPAEPLSLFLRNKHLRFKIPPINIVKNIVLNMLWKMDESKYPKNLKPPATFYGLAFSGCMFNFLDTELIATIKDKALLEGREIEILSHPGGLLDAQEYTNSQMKEFLSFYLSENRSKEAEALSILPQYL